MKHEKIETRESEAAGQRVWIVVVAKGGMEVVAREQLENQGFEVYLPMRLFVNRKGETQAAPFLGRYLFARVPVLVTEWRAVFSTRGVHAVLGASLSRTFGVKDALIEGIRAREEGGFIKLGLLEDMAPASYRKGDLVSIGGLVDAMFEERVDARRASLIVSMFGRDSTVVVDIRKLGPPGLMDQRQAHRDPSRGPVR